jgi:hypothetical protein
MSRTTPMISRQTTTSPWRSPMRLPMALSCGQKRRAMVSLMMTSGALSAFSSAGNRRPSIMGIPRAAKKSALTMV